MTKPILLIPFAKNRVLLNDSNVHRMTTHLSGDDKRMLQQLLSQTYVPIFGQNCEVVQFAFAISLIEQ